MSQNRSSSFTTVFAVYSQALLKTEDEQDVCAASRAKAEQELELAEFDEGIPLSEDGSGKVSVNWEKKNSIFHHDSVLCDELL